PVMTPSHRESESHDYADPLGSPARHRYPALPVGIPCDTRATPAPTAALAASGPVHHKFPTGGHRPWPVQPSAYLQTWSVPSHPDTPTNQQAPIPQPVPPARKHTTNKGRQKGPGGSGQPPQ